jgi:hypothetical protein
LVPTPDERHTVEATLHPPDCPVPLSPAAIGQRIRDHLAPLCYALEVARRAAADNPGLAANLEVVVRQVAAITRLTEELDTPPPEVTGECEGPGDPRGRFVSGDTPTGATASPFPKMTTGCRTRAARP